MYMAASFLEDELIFYKENDEIKSGGYSIKSALLNYDISPMVTMNSLRSTGGGEKVSEPFENLAVPAGLFFINQKMSKTKHEEHWQPHKVIPDDLYDKLFDLINFNNTNKNSVKKRKTRKQILSALKQKKTKKN
jgi:hypothetical protein